MSYQYQQQHYPTPPYWGNNQFNPYGQQHRKDKSHGAAALAGLISCLAVAASTFLYVGFITPAFIPRSGADTFLKHNPDWYTYATDTINGFITAINNENREKAIGMLCGDNARERHQNGASAIDKAISKEVELVVSDENIRGMSWRVQHVDLYTPSSEEDVAYMWIRTSGSTPEDPPRYCVHFNAYGLT